MADPAPTDRQNAWKLALLVVPALITGTSSYLKSRDESKTQGNASYTALRDEIVALQKEVATVKAHSGEWEARVAELEASAETPYLARTPRRHKARAGGLGASGPVVLAPSADAGVPLAIAVGDAGMVVGAVVDEGEPGALPKVIHRKLPASLDDVVDEFQHPKKQQHMLQ